MKGYEELCLLCTRFPELLSLRRFERLSVRILLRRQAELLYLEQELDDFIPKDETRNPGINACFGKLKQISEEQKESLLHIGKFEDVETKLRLYHEMILRVHNIHNINHPSPRNYSRLRRWLGSAEGGNHFLRSIEADPWEREELGDLLSISKQYDRLDTWLSDVANPVYHQLFGQRKKHVEDVERDLGRVWDYDMKSLRYLGDVICVTLSSVIPVASVQGLYWIPTTLGRLFAITGLIIVFSVILMFIAGCRRTEVFAGTSAFAAVLVVFLQGLDGTITRSEK